MSKLDTNHIFIEPLDVEFHQQVVEGFCSGYVVFDHFLKDRATQEQAHNISQTHAMFYENELIGYYTMSCSKVIVEHKEAQDIYGQGDKVSVPALEIPFLAVDRNWQKKGIGTLILDQIINEAMRLADKAGCRYIILHAVREEWLIRWYERNGFEARDFSPGDVWNLPMLFRIPKIRGVCPLTLILRKKRVCNSSIRPHLLIDKNMPNETR
ncbi:MAG: GNAT family N-acetyltransferase, partial [Tumebacillaceae bacterium]